MIMIKKKGKERTNHFDKEDRRELMKMIKKGRKGLTIMIMRTGKNYCQR